MFFYSGADAVYHHYVVFPFPVYEKAYSCLAVFALEWDSRWPLCNVVKHSSGLLTSEIPIISHINLVSLSSSSGSWMCSSLSNVLTL